MKPQSYWPILAENPDRLKCQSDPLFKWADDTETVADFVRNQKKRFTPVTKLTKVK
jgi:hypothetical protein